MTGIIVSTPPTVEPPPSNAAGSTTVLGPLSYTPAIPTLPQTWTAAQTFLPGMLILSGTGAPSNVVMQEVANGALTVRQLAFTDISGFTGTTGSGSFVLATSPTITTPTLVTPTISGLATQAVASDTAQFTLVTGLGGNGRLIGSIESSNVKLRSQNSVTLSLGVNSSDVFTVSASGVTLSQPLTYGGVTLSNAVTGTGAMVLATSPSLTTPVIGSGGLTMTGTTSGTQVLRGPSAASGTITTPAGTYSLVGDTLTQTLFSKTLSGPIVTSSGITINGATSGTTVLAASATASGTLTLPAATDTLVGKATTDTLSNKTLVAPVLGTPASGTLTNCTGLPLAGLATQAAYTITGNFTGSSAVPTASAIGSLTQKASPAATDLVLIQDQAASGQLKYATVSSVASAGSVSSIAGNTGAFTLGRGLTNSTNVLLADPLFHRGYLSGCVTSNNGVAPTTKIDVTAGVWCDDTQAILINAASGSIDCTTTGANGLDTGSLVASTWYYTFAIAKTDGTNAYLASTNATSPTFPTGYTLKRRIGAFRTDGAAHIFGFTQRGQEFYWASPVRDYTISPIATTNSVTVTLASVPPSLVVEAIIVAGISGGTSAANLYVRALTEIDISPAYSTGTVSVRDPTTTNGGGVSPLRIWTNTSQQIAYRSSTTAAASEVDILTVGWFDTLGK